MLRDKFEEELINSLPILRLYALKLTGDIDKAHDLMQEATIRAILAIDTYVDESNFKGWLCTIIYHVFINETKRSSLKQLLFSGIDDNINDSCYSSLDVESDIAFRELMNIIQSSLSDDYFSVFMLFASGYKYREISEILSLPIGTIKSRIHFARGRLQEELNQTKRRKQFSKR